jgi:hypothetical protein
MMVCFAAVLLGNHKVNDFLLIISLDQLLRTMPWNSALLHPRARRRSSSILLSALCQHPMQNFQLYLRLLARPSPFSLSIFHSRSRNDNLNRSLQSHSCEPLEGLVFQQDQDQEECTINQTVIMLCRNFHTHPSAFQLPFERYLYYLPSAW